MINGVELIAAERQRRIDAEGFTAKYDDVHTHGELASAGAAYAETAGNQGRGFRCVGKGYKMGSMCWPTNWELEWFKPSDDPIRNLVKAGALICAEIDRLQRKAAL